jgi:hypothetical protein
MTTLASITKFVGINFSGGAGGPSARFGTLSLSFARFGSDTDDDSDYTDLNSYVLSMNITRGRSRELEEFAAGSCVIRLDNLIQGIVALHIVATSSQGSNYE